MFAKTAVRSLLRHAGLLNDAYRLHEYISPNARRNAQLIKESARKLFPGDNNEGFAPALRSTPAIHRAFVMGVSSVDIAVLQCSQIVAARLAGYDVLVVLPTPSPALENVYLKLGASSFVYMTDCIGRFLHPEARKLLNAIQTQEDLHELFYRGVPVGKFTLSTLMRRSRRGRLNVSDSAVRTDLEMHLSQSLHHTDGAIKIMNEAGPSIAFFIDRGYTPEGEMFEAALLSGAGATTLNTAHRSGLVIFKRYDPLNKGQHYASLSGESWRRVLNMPFTDRHWQMVHDELKDAYESGQWYDEVGTQFGKSLIDRAAIARELGLDPKRKTAVLFAHMFWDATFFWGADLFEDYEEWFIESLKVMAENDSLNWIVKLHPANSVKDHRDGFVGDNVEYDAIRRAIGELPSHIKVLAPDAPISTFSLFQAIDYCLTVRGTVGIEAACFGIPVITAGTGRYDGLGFTVDHQDSKAYLETLRNLSDVKPMDDSAVELARRFAWGLLFARTLELTSVQFSYEQNAQATLHTRINPDAISHPENMPDIQTIRDWLISGTEDLTTANDVSCRPT